jgi:peptide/nickel transport system substrate-binding protein
MGGQVTGDDAFGWNSNLQDYPYDPDLAKSLLAEAGYPNGVELGDLFMGEPAEWLKQQDFVEVIRSQFAEVGITFEPQVVDESTFLRMALQEYSLKYWHVGGWQYHPVMDSGFAVMWYDSEAFLRTGLGDPAYDEVWRASEQAVDLEERRGLLEQAHQIIHDTPGPVFLWQHHKLYGLSPQVQGVVPTPDERIHWAGVTIQA